MAGPKLSIRRTVTLTSQPDLSEYHMVDSNDVVTMNDGDVVIWTDSNSSLHIKCVTKHGDPVELNADEVAELVTALQTLARTIV